MAEAESGPPEEKSAAAAPPQPGEEATAPVGAGAIPALNHFHRGERLSAHFARLKEIAGRDGATLGELFDNLSSKDHPLLILLLSLPFLLPTPPGLSAVFGAVIIAASIAMICGRPPGVPARFRGFSINGPYFAKVFDLSRRLAARIERWIRPRFRYLCKTEQLFRMHGVALAVLGLLLALPGPAFFNFPPAALLIIFALGIIEEDGALLAFGYTVLAAGIVAAILFLPLLIEVGTEWTMALWNRLFG